MAFFIFQPPDSLDMVKFDNASVFWMPYKQRPEPFYNLHNCWSKQFDNQFQRQDTRDHANSHNEIEEIVKSVKGFRNKSEYLSQICFNVFHISAIMDNAKIHLR